MANQVRPCDCGCGRKLVRRPNEAYQDFERRKYFSRECAKKRKVTFVHLVPKECRKPAIFRPEIDLFLYGRVI